MTPYQKRVKTYLQDQCQVCLDQIVCKRDGTLEVKRGYFYRFGTTAETWADSVAAALKTADIPAHVYGRDDWAAWPKTSYFTAVICE